MTIKQFGGVFGRNPEFNTVTASNVVADAIDLSAIAASKAVTAVDVFVYDTSKDSDGGAWRKRTQHTSWYNETLNTATRGARREFPAVAVIVAESNKVTIYDGDDPSLPMWMVFNEGNFNNLVFGFNSLNAVNGVLCSGNNEGNSNYAGLMVVRFVTDDLIGVRNSTYPNSHNSILGVVNRNAAWPQAGSRGLITSGGGLVSALVNDVAMTVLPDAPIDPATGLPVPTIAVATDGGVSVINNDGTVADGNNTAYGSSVSFTKNGEYLLSGRVTQSTNQFAVCSSDDYLTDGFDIDRLGVYNSSSSSSVPTLLPSKASPSVGYAISAGDLFASWNDNGDGLSLIDGNVTTQAKGMVAYTTSSYNTGWMNGDIKGAFLSSTDTASLVGSGELVTNGDFATGDLTGWTDNSTGTGSVTVNSNAVDMNGPDANNRAIFAQQVTAASGDLLVLQINVSSFTSGEVVFGLTTNGLPGGQFITRTASGKISLTLRAASTNPWVTVWTGFFGGVATVDDISVKLADNDRSVNNNGLIINGTVTRTAVATGAELVAYSGFSASNYLEQPYNSDLDFGTGDFCVMGWVKGATSLSTTNIVSRGSSNTNGFQLWKETTSVAPYARFRIGSTVLNGTTGITDQWNHIVAVRKSGVAYIYKNGVFESSVAATADVSGSYVTQVGWSTTNPMVAALAGIALLRISATAPTAEQISRIYNDEKHLFTENAACTIAGTSDAVTDLAHDSTTNLLHVGSSYGRSVFQGLRRVSNTTTAVGTAISASGGLVVEE